MKILYILAFILSLKLGQVISTPIENIIVINAELIKKKRNVTVSVYHAVAAQCNADYTTTAWKYKIDTLDPYKHRYIAISRDLEDYFSHGDSLYLDIDYLSGWYMVADRMNKKWENRIDVLVDKSIYDKFETVIEL